MRHLDQDEAVAEANQLLFLNAGATTPPGARAPPAATGRRLRAVASDFDYNDMIVKLAMGWTWRDILLMA